MRVVHAENLSRLINCNGSYAMTGDLAPVISGGSEGVAATYAANMIFSGQATPQQLIDTAAPNGVFITDTMLEAVQVYVNAIRHNGAIYDQVAVDCSFGNEKWKIQAIAHHVALVGPTLFVDQFAFGWGIVEPEYNWFLIACAVGFCQITNAKPETIVLTVHQPRASHPLGPCREETIDFATLQKYSKGIQDVMSHPSERLNTGANWCRKCPALYDCPAARGAAMNAIEFASTVSRDNLTGQDLSQELINLERAKSAIKDRLEAITERASHLLKNGDVVPDFALTQHYSQRRWQSYITAEMLVMLTGCTNVTATKMLSPAQLQAQGISESVINSLSERAATTPKLTRVDANKRAKKHLTKES